MKKTIIIFGMLFLGVTLAIPQSNLDDADIADAIENEFRFDHAINVNNIEVAVLDGIVELTGSVNNLKAKMAAEKLAEHTTGVTGVTNRIKVRADEAFTDAEVKADIKNSLENKEAEWMASGVQGVNDVNNILTVNFPYSHYWWGHYPYYSLYISPPESTSLVPDDDLIKTRVANELWWSPYVDRDQISITVNNGNVTLEGTVDSWREYRKAAENARKGGAWTVTNELVVR